MTILFTKEFGTVNGAALQAFAAMCAAGQSFFGEALVVRVAKFAPDRGVTPKQVAALALDAYKTGYANHNWDGPTPVGFDLNQSGIRHGGGRTRVVLQWDGLVALECDSDEVDKHANSMWIKRLTETDELVERWAATATAVVGADWSTPGGGDRIATYEHWHNWALNDLTWRADRAGLTGNTPFPATPELLEGAKAWAAAYVAARDAELAAEPPRRGPAKRVVIRRAQQSETSTS